MLKIHKYWMYHALHLAQRALDEGEVPVGAVIVHKNKLIGEGWNNSISNNDPTGHAEIIALRKGGKVLQNYRLLECTMYVTLEPCLMCSGAIVHGRIGTLVYGALDNQKIGYSIIDLLINSSINHKIQVIGGILAPKCSEILRKFFKKRRKEKLNIVNKEYNKYNLLKKK